MDQLHSFNKNGYSIALSEYLGVYLVAIHGAGKQAIRTYKREANARNYFEKLRTSYNYSQERLKI